ncbi:LysE family translocator [Halococcoides cellulosivorans]|uniref:Lysine transporter LysE n=1 Tax=Halococcoides cellulosivorans TaxID=1679096 RepID=A0A2R4X0H0_9EURY|nr:LysE family transporter [Halococcoides cellulosivorans]AWB27275.1 lysine transporter LysE [Halococcoides cellulosivorans]
MALATALWTTVAGAVFGLALAVPPGPMNAVIAEESVRNGMRSGVIAGLGAMAADAIFLGLALVGVVAVVRDVTLLRGAMLAIGGVLMCYFAIDAVRTAGWTTVEGIAPAETDDSDVRGFRRAFVLAMTNPFQIVFWLTVGVGLLDPGDVDVLGVAHESLAGQIVVRTGDPLLIVGLFAGIAVWIVAFPAALVALGRRIERFATLIAAGSALVLAGFGVAFLVQAGGLLL